MMIFVYSNLKIWIEYVYWKSIGLIFSEVLDSGFLQNRFGIYSYHGLL